MPDSLRVPGFIAIGLVLLAYFMAESGRLLLALVRRHRRPPQDHGTLPAIAAAFFLSEVAAFAFLLFAPRLDFAGQWWAWQLAGGGLASGNAAGLAICVLAPLVVLIARIRVEERALLAELGATYARYIQGRKRLMPFVW